MAEVTCPSRSTVAPTTGRPTTYTDELANELCERLAGGESLRRICSDEDMPHQATVIRWLARRTAFLARYEIARRLQADTWRDQIYDLSNAAPPRDAKGRVDLAALMHRQNQIGTLQWLAVKLLPKRRG